MLIYRSTINCTVAHSQLNTRTASVMRDIALERNKCSVERAIVLFLFYRFALSSLSIFNGSTVLKNSLFDGSHKIERTKKFVFARHTTNEANARAPQASASFYTLSLASYLLCCDLCEINNSNRLQQQQQSDERQRNRRQRRNKSVVADVSYTYILFLY